MSYAVGRIFAMSAVALFVGCGNSPKGNGTDTVAADTIATWEREYPAETSTYAPSKQDAPVIKGSETGTSAPPDTKTNLSPYYNKGYDAGYDDGEEDAVNQNGWQASFDDDSPYEGRKAKQYADGYFDGYEAGYDDNNDRDYGM